MSQDIHAPYHFVPHAKQVLMPEWAHLVSHDVPFENGLSGVLSVTLNNETPLCVGGLQNKKDSEPAQVLWAKDPMGNPTIPGSSLKGMIRNAMEIATLGKLNAVDNQQFSFRDISSAKSNYLKNVIGSNKVQSGWLNYNSTQKRWEFTACSNVKVKHEDINNVFGSKISNASDSQRAENRYEQLPLITQAFANISEPRGKQDNRWADDLAKTSKGEFDSKQQGHFVFTNKRIEGQGNPSDYEFSYFFYGENDRPSFTEISSTVDSLFSNHDEKHVKYLQKEQGPLGIPVFALIEKDKGTLHSLGLAKMPRVSYKNTVQDLIGNNGQDHLSDSVLDFAELIFGTLRENALGLKSRVIFSDATADPSNSALYSSNSLILNNPKPTFYPAYLEQPTQGSYSDYDGKSQLAGFKRYISKAPEYLELTENNVPTKQNNVASRLQLAPKDSSFTSRIVFHNLLPVELGALLWCLSLGNDEAHLHQLGHGKPYGAGAVRLNIDIDRIQENNPKDKAHTIESLTQDFSDYMNTAYNEDKPDAWINSPQVQYLLALSNLKDNEGVDTRYMSIDDKEFQRAKTAHERLEPFNNLNRSDDDNKIQPSLAFGQGRLSNLIDCDEAWQRNRLEDVDSTLQQEKSNAERQSLPECMQRIEILKSAIKNSDTTQVPPLLRDAIADFIKSSDYQNSSAFTLYNLAHDNEYHKRPKKRVKENKAELEELSKKYNLSL
jgi:CRISPR-associated protein (TIGR03986 family)